MPGLHLRRHTRNKGLWPKSYSSRRLLHYGIQEQNRCQPPVFGSPNFYRASMMFLSITMLNALTGEFANVHDHVATTMASLTDPLKPFESSSIRARLDLEQQLINNDTSQSSITLLSHTPGRTQGCSHKHSDKKCSNTKCPSPSGHTLPDCWAPGVGMEGKRDEVLASRKAKREARGKTGDPSATSSI